MKRNIDNAYNVIFSLLRINYMKNWLITIMIMITKCMKKKKTNLSPITRLH